MYKASGRVVSVCTVCDFNHIFADFAPQNLYAWSLFWLFMVKLNHFTVCSIPVGQHWLARRGNYQGEVYLDVLSYSFVIHNLFLVFLFAGAVWELLSFTIGIFSGSWFLRRQLACCKSRRGFIQGQGPLSYHKVTCQSKN